MKKNLLKRAAIVGFIFTAFITTTASALTAVASGNWSSAATWGGTAPGTNVSSTDINIPSGITVTLDQEVTFSGLLNSFTVNGSLTGSSSMNNSVSVSSGSFTGNGTVNIERLSFTGVLATMSFSGTLTVDQFINSGALLTLGATTSVNDTLNLDGGSISIGSGGNLTLMTNSNVRVNSGTISIGGGVFNSSNNYSVQYVGSSKTTGLELNTTTLQALYVDMNDNSQSVTLGANTVVNSTVHMDMGKLNLGGKELTLNGDLMTMSGGSVITPTSTSKLTVNGNMMMTNGLMFDSGANIGDLTINHSGSNVMLMNALNVSGTLRLLSNSVSVESGSALVMNSGSTVHVEGGSILLNGGTFTGISYNVEYMGSMSASTGPEITANIHDLTVNVQSTSNTVTLNNDATVGGSLALQSGVFSLNNRKVTLNGTLSQDAGAWIRGSAGSDLELNLTSAANDTLFFDETGSGNTLSHLTINNAAGTLALGSDLKIATELNMMSGKFDINDNNLTVQSAASITNYDNTRYIITSGSGKLGMNVNASSAYVEFPIGTSTAYAPASIQQTGPGTTGNFMVNAMDGVYTNNNMSTGFNSASTGSMVNKTWNVSADGGVVMNSNLRFGWTSGSEVNGFDRNHAYATRFNGASWDVKPFQAATSGPSSTYQMERMSNTNGGSYAVVDSASSIVLGIADQQAQSTNILLYPNPTTETIYIQVPKTDNVVMYELIDITGQTLFSALNKNTINTFDVSNLNAGYYFIKATDMNNKQVTTKRFIKS